MIQVEDADFARLLDRVKWVTAIAGFRPLEALQYIAGEKGWVDVRRFARAKGWTHTQCTEALRALLQHGLAERDGRKWRFAFRGVQRV